VEGAPAAGHVAAQPACGLGTRNGFIQRGDGMRILAAHIDKALGGAHGQAGDGHALDQRVGVALHQQPVSEGA
jgi:hypothetical protein